MPLTGPGGPPRGDLPWLRRRALTSAPVDYVHHSAPHAGHPPGSTGPALPAGAPSLDLSPAAPVRPVASAPSLDLSPAAPVRPVASAPSLDLSPGALSPSAPTGRQGLTRLPYPRVQPGARVVLARPHPTVTLTRLQGGIGQLRATLLRGARSGDLAMGLICETADGEIRVVQRLGSAPTSGELPLALLRLIAPVGGADAADLDLRQIRRLRRLLVYGYSPSVAVLEWDAVLTVGLHDGTLLEVPFDLGTFSGTVALLTGYLVDGELVLRAELECFAGPPEAAALGYGYAHGWVDGRLPVH